MSTEDERRNGGESAAREARSVEIQPRSPARRDGLFVWGLALGVTATVKAARLPFRAARPIIMSRPMQPAREAADTAVRVVVDALASVIAEQLQYNLEVQALIDQIVRKMLADLAAEPLVAELIKVQARGYIDYLADNPDQARRLVDAVAGQYIEGLRQNPTLLRPLVRSVAGDYIEWLNANPQTVDSLVATAATNFMATLRERPSLVDPLVRDIAGRYVGFLTENTALLDALVEGVAGGFLAHLEAHPEQLDGVVGEVGSRYMATLRQDSPELTRLVQTVGDRYMEHLQENPSNVQDLLTGQSMNMATEIVEEVRNRSSSADTTLDKVVRNLLRLKPRPENAPPPSLADGGA